ncbi:restriction endonuclease subunit S [Streptomyces sp. NPDC007100]|uniref:restriction endonuclease subunit S n=1 Tax=Streptomyces sp. NPDC007100 TaxID=3155602 RepID=UPI0033DDDD97
MTWVRLPIKRLGDVFLGKMIQPEPKSRSDVAAPYLRAAHVQPNGQIIDADDKTMWFSEEELRLHDLRAGDVVIVEGGAGYGRSAVLRTERKGWGFQNSIVRVRPCPSKAEGRFLDYALQAALAAGEIGIACFTATIPHFTADKVGAFLVPAPPVREQRAVADFLDRETARIDILIEEQHRLIDMLQERRKALVEEIVFGGLDGSATSANVEPWLPATPAHWRVMQLGFMSDTLAGYAFPSEGFSSDEDHVRLLRGVNVKPGRIDWADVVYWDSHAAPVPVEFDLQAGDLVFGMDRPFVGGGVRIATISREDLPALLLQRVMRIRPEGEEDPAYVRYVMATEAFYDYLEPLFTGVSVPHVSEWQVRKFKMPFPPLDEQRRIARHLDAQTAKIDTLIAEAERFIELSRERRSALIMAAVNGQIDVREAA